MDSHNTINLLFAATTDFLPYATVTAISAYKNLNPKYKLNVYFFFADIIKEINDTERNNIIETAMMNFKALDINFKVINVTKYMNLFKDQNFGMWGEAVSLTHYMYLLAPKILTDVDKVVYLDTDMIVNTDISIPYNIDMGDCLLGMGAPRGMEEMGDDVSNSGFVIFNLDKWRYENTLETLLEFGRNLPRARFCDQYLLYQYFTINNPNRLYLFDKEYNIFPQLFEDITIEDIKILHFTGWKCKKAWKTFFAKQRANYLWWQYARETFFYEMFILNNIDNLETKIEKLIDKSEAKIKKLVIKNKNLENKIKEVEQKSFGVLLQKIFSVKNCKTHKIITILGVKIKFRRRIKNA